MTFWLDLFTGTTWNECRDAGAKVTGFRASMKKNAGRIKPGDVLVCYITGVKRWVGALEVIEVSNDKRRIWQDDEFPVRFDVRPMILLDPDFGVSMDDLLGKVSFYDSERMAGKFDGFVRMSPNKFRNQKDGLLILRLLEAAAANPKARPVDPRKLARKPKYKVLRKQGRSSLTSIVTIPESDSPSEALIVPGGEVESASSRHSEMQFQLLSLGSEMGLKLWVARNDRGKAWNGIVLGNIDGNIEELPTQFNEATNRTIELIDVLWLKGNSIIAAFEVESTTSIYSGLLRMSDLMALQPNLDIDLYIVAPDERRDKVEQEILRPTFMLRDKPLNQVCGFLPFSKLTETVSGVRRLDLASSLKPDFLKKTAEYFKEN